MEGGKKYYLGCSLVNRDAALVLFISSAKARRHSAGCAEGASAGNLRISASRALQASSQNAADLTMERKSRINLAAQRVAQTRLKGSESGEEKAGEK